MSIKKILKEVLGFTYYNLFRRYQNIVGNRVVLYHSIGSKLKHDSYGISISKERFIQHIKFLKENYEIIPLDTEYTNSLDRDTISITLDDGYKDNLIALEICEKYEIPFTLYITTGLIGQEDYLSEEDIKLFAKSDKCLLGTHSVTHPHLDTLSYDEQYYELNQSKITLENIIDKEVTSMSYPHGCHNQDTLDIVKKLGYKIVSSSKMGMNTKENINLIKIKRVEIVADDNLKKLSKKTSGYYDFLSLKT
jgi:peptidoglycan/xylan/chitin deacetylase (PgdA/CDA1 family)